MPVLGILTCEILELEIAHLLTHDPSISHIFVIDQEASQGMIRALGKNNQDCFTVLESSDAFHPPQDKGLIALVQVLELGLHSLKSKLQNGIVQESRKLGSRVDALLLGYGLCGNALSDPPTLLSHLDIPFFLPWDQDHPVDDCVGLFIGGREAYHQEQIKEAGTFFMTPGWTNHWKWITEKGFGKMSEKMAQRIFKDYKRTLLISTPVMNPDQMEKNIQEFNHQFHCYSESCPGSMDMLDRAWQEAKTHVLTHHAQANQPKSPPQVRDRIKRFEKKIGRRPRILLLPMNPGESQRNIKITAGILADMGCDVDISPGFQTPGAAARMAVENDVHAVGILGLQTPGGRFEADLKKALADEGSPDIKGVLLPSTDNHPWDKTLEIETIAKLLDAIDP